MEGEHEVSESELFDRLLVFAHGAGVGRRGNQASGIVEAFSHQAGTKQLTAVLVGRVLKLGEGFEMGLATGLIASSCATMLPLFDEVNIELLVRDEQHHDVRSRCCAMLHQHSLREPDKAAGTEVALMGDQGSFQHVHAVSTGVGVPRGSEARWIAEKADLHARVRVLEQELAEVALAEHCLVPFLPRHGSRVDGDHLVLFHVGLRVVSFYRNKACDQGPGAD